MQNPVNITEYVLGGLMSVCLLTPNSSLDHIISDFWQQIEADFSEVTLHAADGVGNLFKSYDITIQQLLEKVGLNLTSTAKELLPYLQR